MSLKIMGMPKIKIFLLIIFVVFGFLVFGKAKAGTTDNVSGWAWSENIGWISFNCYNDYNGDGILEDHCSSSNYGVKLDPSTKIFSGYAWSENIGWITFNESELSGCPVSPCRAWLDSSNNVQGWARALAYGGGWDGWISLRNDSKNYGVWLDTSTSPQEFRNWAWSDMVIGWISFNCKNQNSCATSNYKVYLTTSLNPPPTAENLSVDAQSSDVICGQVSGSQAKFSWTFVDPGDSQSAYQIQIDNNPDFSSPEVDTGKILSSSQSFFLQLPYPLLNWGAPYYWKLQVWDSASNTSGWINGPSFTTPSHAYPSPDFTPSPPNPVINELVTFIDNSICYSAGNVEYYCKNGASTQYQWDFQDDNVWDSTYKGNATTTYSNSVPYTIRLRITNSIGSCDTTRQVNVSHSLPEWKEVPPF
jgi:hypothetical protein